MGRLFWKLKRIFSSLWFRASIFGVLAVVTALLAYYFKDYIPESTSQKIGADAVDSLLNIIASTMLAVTIFSLSAMVSAYSAATTNVTPRSTRLLLDDKTSQTVLSTFLGVFIYSLVGIIALKIGLYGSSGRLILFVVTIMVIVIIVMTLIRWIEYLSRLGRVGETINLVAKATRDATIHRIKNPYLGGTRLESIPKKAKPLYAGEIGYVQFIDMPSLSAIAKEADSRIYICSLPGTFNTPDRPIAFAVNLDIEKYGKKVADCFVIGDDRSFEQDPRFGMVVLSEIASRALSPAINDPGTAIGVIGISVRILSLWCDKADRPDIETPYPLVFVPPLQFQDIFDDVFLPIARDGAGIREIGLRLQKAFIALASMGDEDFAKAAENCSQDAVDRARHALSKKSDLEGILQLRQYFEGGTP